jgi:cell division protein FtsB
MRDGSLHSIRALRLLFESQNTIRKKLIWAAVLGALLLFFLFVVGGNYGILKIVSLYRERKGLEKRISTLQSERDSLKSDIEKLKGDVREIERVARENYGMARPGEKVLKFVEPRDTARRP